MQIKVSVIIPIYNMARYLGECLDSVMRQTLREIEVIAIDDGSTDDSLPILKKYQKAYDNIVVLQQRNQGAANARNNGIRHARGEYIAVMDPDDFYPQNDSLEELYKAAKKYNVTICGGIMIRNCNGVRIPANEMQDREYFCNRMVATEEYPYLNGHTRFLFRTEMLRDNNIYYPEYRRFADPPFTLRAFLCAGGFYGIDKEVYEYRVGHKYVRYSLEISKDILYGIRDVFKMARENNLENLCQKSLGNIYNIYIIPKYKYSFCGYEEIDRTIEEINGIIAGWHAADPEWILTREKVMQYRKECLTEQQKILNILKSNYVIIYGAGAWAARFLRMYSGNTENVIGAAVTRKSNSNEIVEGVKVRQIEEYISCKDKVFVLVVVDEKYFNEIEYHLCLLGFPNIYKVDRRKNEVLYEFGICC